MCGTRRSLPQTTLLRLDELLSTECVELPRPSGAGVPKLTDGPTPTISLTIEEALRQMSEDYEVIARVVAAVADVWGEPTERLNRVAGEVEELERRLRDQGARQPNELQTIARAVDETELLAGRPLGAEPGNGGGTAGSSGAPRASLEEILRGRGGAARRPDGCRGEHRRRESGLAAGREELDRGGQKILVPDETWGAWSGWRRDSTAWHDVELARRPGRGGLLRSARVSGLTA